jgi:hypothetical protein
MRQFSYDDGDEDFKNEEKAETIIKKEIMVPQSVMPANRFLMKLDETTKENED